MRSLLDDTFQSLKSTGSKALIPFLTSGYPDEESFLQLARLTCESGADVLELGFPHSDPLADGPVIQHSSHTAIQNGFTVERAFREIATLRREHSTPIVIMCYSNLVLRRTARTFIQQCVDSGVAGLIVPDMIIEESEKVRELCQAAGMSFINLITPTTEVKRAAFIAKISSGYIYLVSVAGTTGVRTQLNAKVRAITARLRKTTDLPICVGFGIASADMAAEVANDCDGVIIGSKLIQLIDEDNNKEEYAILRAFLTDVKAKLGGKHDARC